VTLELLKLIAPFMPFFAEHCYQDYYRKFEKIESIHLMDWPKPNEKLIDDELNSSMEIVRKIVESSFSSRQSANIKRRWPVGEIFVVSEHKNVVKSVKNLEEVLLKMCNCKCISVVKKSPKGEFSEAEFDFGKVLINKKLDEKLLEEALIREVIREIQSLRKKYGFNVKENINLTLSSDEKSNAVLKKYVKDLKKEVGAKDIALGKMKGQYKGTLKFENIAVEIAFDR
jgi:valyl-tRNA synthetase